MFPLRLFDYLSSSKGKDTRTNARVIDVDFAGNLSREKSGFLYKLGEPPVRINLYGKREKALPDYVNYIGGFEPDELPAVMNGDYGLVWDGESIDSCVGNYGEYLKYNNPHKASLYIVAEKPLIVWKESALADYVTENKIGITINSLKELEYLPDVESKEYLNMKKNIISLANKLKVGDMLKNTLAKVLNEII